MSYVTVAVFSCTGAWGKMGTRSKRGKRWDSSVINGNMYYINTNYNVCLMDEFLTTYVKELIITDEYYI